MAWGGRKCKGEGREVERLRIIRMGVRGWMDGSGGTEARDTSFFDGWEMARSQRAARVRGVVYYV